MSTTLGIIKVFGSISVVFSIIVSIIVFVEGNITKVTDPYRSLNSAINSLFFHYTHSTYLSDTILNYFGQDLGYYVQTYVRDLVFGTILYWVTAGLWHLYIYKLKVNENFHNKNRPLPLSEVIEDQMLLAQSSMFLYAALPCLSEYLIENKMTKVYFYLDEVGGWPFYVLYLIIYMTLVELGVYWMHRTLHTNKFLYKYIHGLHHKYNKASTLTPWASVAFNPIDGILQASPYVFFLFFVPVHYLTHLALLFFTGVWATNIHDSMWSYSEPIMGSKYHTMHHTHYHYNFGQFFVFCDQMFGTLKVPEKSKFD